MLQVKICMLHGGGWIVVDDNNSIVTNPDLPGRLPQFAAGSTLQDAVRQFPMLLNTLLTIQGQNVSPADYQDVALTDGMEIYSSKKVEGAY